MTLPLVSIALCTYNGEKFLIEQLDSIINQTYSNLEIIVVDDCSSDQTLSILKSYASRFSNFKIYQNEVNLGYAKNFEKAISLCNGSFICLSDQDDIWALNKIELQIDTIGDNILIYHDSEFINEQGLSMNKKMSDVIRMYQGNDFKPLLFFNSLSGHAVLFSKELVQHALPFPEKIMHDRWLGFTATNVGTIKYIDQALVKYRQHENSDTDILKLKRNKAEDTFYGKIGIEKTVQELEIFAQYKFNKNQGFIARLLKLYQTRLNLYLCFGLIFFLYANYKSLLFISKKSTMSKLNFIFKHIWGSKLKAS